MPRKESAPKPKFSLLEKIQQKLNVGPDRCDCDDCPTCEKGKRHHKYLGMGIILIVMIFGISYFSEDLPLQFQKQAIENCDLRTVENDATDGDVGAMMFLVDLYADKCQYLPFADKQKNYWLTQAAEAGDPRAQYTLALLYRLGETLPRNYRESIKWLKLAAGQEYMPAEYELAKLYKKGHLFIEENADQFIFWLTNAANHGSDKAAAELGYLYEKGIFVPESPIEAYKWYSISTTKDINTLDMLELSMSKEEIERAQREASVLYKKISEKIQD